MRRNIWFFGDSYIEHDDNWVRYVADRCKAKIQELGAGGSSTSYLLDRLHTCGPRMKKEDYVVVAITDPTRHYLGKLHLMEHMVRRPDVKHLDMSPYGMIENEFVRELNVTWEDLRSIDSQMKVLDTLNAYDRYIRHLYDSHVFMQDYISVANNIITNILPNLPTKNVIYFYSINRSQYEDSKFWQKGTQPTAESFYHLQLDYFAEDRKMADEGEIMIELRTPNHWVTDPKMQKKFWSTYNPILKLIGADNPDLII